MTKITQEQKNQMIKLREEGKKNNEIAKEYKISPQAVCYHLNEEYSEKKRKEQREKYQKLSKEERKEIYEKKKDYLKKYMKNRYNTDQNFRIRQIMAVQKNKKKKRKERENETRNTRTI